MIWNEERPRYVGCTFNLERQRVRDRERKTPKLGIRVILHIKGKIDR